MDITHKVINNQTILLKLQGQLSLDTIEYFKKEALTYINHPYANLILQLEFLDYISSAGIQTLYQLLDKIKEQNGKFILCAPKPAIKKIFDVVSIESDIPVLATEQEALQRCNA